MVVGGYVANRVIGLSIAVLSACRCPFDQFIDARVISTSMPS